MDSAPAEPRQSRWAEFKGSLGYVVLGAWLVLLLVIAFYVEENWRGAHAWKLAKAELEARGESFDPAKFIPAPVPDSQNFGVLPFFRNDSESGPAGLQSLMYVTERMPSSKEDAAKPGKLPYLGYWWKGDPINAPDVRQKLEAFLREQKPKEKIPADATPAQLFGMICPDLADLRAANATHPLCRFDWDYAAPPWKRKLGNITAGIRIAQLLTYEQRLALLSHDPELTLEDLRVGWKISSGIRKSSNLVSALVNMGVVAIELQTVNQALAEHVWDDRQLASLDSDLGEIDFLADSQFCLRGEVDQYVVPIYDYLPTHRSTIVSPEAFTSGNAGWGELILDMRFYLIPNGWFDLGKTKNVLLMLDGTKAVDPVARRVFPQRVPPPEPYVDDERMNFLTGWAGTELEAIKTASYNQVQVDEARIACRLERYRLAHSSYPAALDALTPAYGETPHDIMNGKPYHYKLNSDGTYLLYSVGWNQVDDHGNAGAHRSKDSLDWIWANYPEAPKK